MNRSLLSIVPAVLVLVACAGSNDADEPTSGVDSADVAGSHASLDADDPGPLACGGLLGLGCPDKFVCVDDWRDDCDPDTGGADCSGLCERSDGAAGCATSIPGSCATGEVCVIAPGFNPCAPPADDVPPMCFDGACVAADCGLVPPYDTSILDCSNTPIRCAPGWVSHEDACGCSCVPQP